MPCEIVSAAFNGKKNLTGQEFGDWLVLTYAGYAEGKRRNHYWNCRCKCGRERMVAYASLTRGASISCACSFGEPHRLTGSPIHAVWASIISRCEDEGSRRYADYGGRGIRICQRWRESLLAFFEDMGERPHRHTVERNDNAGHYSCGKCAECLEHGWAANCRWATYREQGRNKRDNHVITVDGVSKLLCEWVEETGMNYVTIIKRLNRGWSEKDAITTPVNPNRRNRLAKAVTAPEV